LLLHVGASGTKSWQYRYRWHGKRLKLTLGQYPTTTILRAHQLARSAHAALEKGIDPRRANLAQRAVKAAVPEGGDDAHAIETLIAEYLTRYVAKRTRHPERAKERVKRLLEKELAAWRGRDARTITPREVVSLLDGIVDRGSPVMANRVAGTLSKVFKLGVQRAIVEANPVQVLLPPGGVERARTRALSDAELSALLTGLDEVFTHAPRTAAVIRLVLYTACRRSEIGLARWSHFDLDAGVWRVPPALSKTGVEYLNPLVPEAVAELKRLKFAARGSAYVFPAKNGGVEHPAHPLIVTRSLARNLSRWKKRGVASFTLHDLRRTVRTGLARLGVPPHIAERVLNHKARGIVATYDTHSYLDEKRDALQKWADHLKSIPAAQ
jgi:integrase